MQDPMSCSKIAELLAVIQLEYGRHHALAMRSRLPAMPIDPLLKAVLRQPIHHRSCAEPMRDPESGMAALPRCWEIPVIRETTPFLTFR